MGRAADGQYASGEGELAVLSQLYQWGQTMRATAMPSPDPGDGHFPKAVISINGEKFQGTRPLTGDPKGHNRTGPFSCKIFKLIYNNI
jgi:hypothetical protein